MIKILNFLCDVLMTTGPKIVLTAPATEMSNHYGKIFLGFGACISNPPFPLWFTKLLFYPSVKHKDGRAVFAPYNLRKIEATLLEGDFNEDEVITVHPNRLDKTITPQTRVVGITVMDPLGLGPTSLTFSSIFNGETATYTEFKKLMMKLSTFNLKSIVGGPGAWQLYYTKDAQEKYRISTLVLGEGESIASQLFKAAVEGGGLPKVAFGEDLDVEQIPVIKNPSICGLVEISRGCGRNCQFCIPTVRGKRDHPIKRIIDEVKINVNAGLRNACLHAEDTLMYGSGPENRFRPKREKVLELFSKVIAERKTMHFGVSHVALSTIAADPKLLEEINELMCIGKNRHASFFGYQTGIETGSVKLIKKYMGGKPLPFKPEQWPEVVAQAFGVSKDYRWIPASTIIMGLPGETVDDVTASLELVDKLKDTPSFIVPQFFVPITETILENKTIFDVAGMKEEHWQLLIKCLDHSVRWANLLRTLYFKQDSPLLKLGYWLGYRGLYLFAMIGGIAATRRLGLKIKQLKKELNFS